jgi:hypothetical protein
MSEFPLRDMLQDNVRLIKKVEQLESLMDKTRDAANQTCRQLEEKIHDLKVENERLSAELADLKQHSYSCPKCGVFNRESCGLCPKCTSRAQRRADMFYALLDADATFVFQNTAGGNNAKKLKPPPPLLIQ